MRILPFLRAMDIVMLSVLLAVIVWTFKVKNDSQLALERVSDLHRQLEAEKTEIDLLKSDWGLLTNPQRLEQLVKRYREELGLEGIQPSQLTGGDSLPPLVPPFDPEANNPEFAGTDEGLKTGSVQNGDMQQ